jgi:hypothetical protein
VCAISVSSVSFALEDYNVGVVTVQPSLKTSHPQEYKYTYTPPVFEAPKFFDEPWYLSNPISRIMFNFLSTGYNLIRLDRIFLNRDGSYIDPLSDSFGSAMGHTVGIIGDLQNDFSRAVNRTEAAILGFSPAEGILQCTSFLPLYVTKADTIQGLTQLKHSWIQIGKESYGMPYGFGGDLFGPAVIRNPDPHVNHGVRGVICTNVLKPDDEDPILFKEKYNCIARRLSVADSYNGARPELQLSYDLFDNNCVAAARYLTECAGGRLTQSPNFAVGTSINWDEEVIEAKEVQSEVQEFQPLFALIAEIKNEYMPFLKKFRKERDRAYVEGWDFAAERIRERVGELQKAIEAVRPTRKDLNIHLITDNLGPKSWKEPVELSFKTFGIDYAIESLEKHPLSALQRLDSGLFALNTDLLRRTYMRVKSTYRTACENARLACGR